MSAAGPLPSYLSSIQPNGRPMSATSNGGGDRVFAHIQDLQFEALADCSPQSSVTALLGRADTALAQAKLHIDLRRPDQAFVNYLRAYEIAVDVLPRHKDYTHFIHDQHGEEKLRLLQRRISAMDEQFDKIKKIIVNNNNRSGILPKNQQHQVQALGHTRAESLSATAMSGAQKVKPSVSPKPEKLHARPTSYANRSTNASTTSPTADVLSDRFAKLRGIGLSDATKRPDSRGSNSSTYSLNMPSASDYARSLESLPSSKPQGPRNMPEGEALRSTRLPLDTDLAAAMPKAPSPTYSPARNMQTTGNIAPPRHTARSLAGSSSRKSSSVPTPTAMTPNGTGDYFSNTQSQGVVPGQVPRRKSVHMPKETRISADRLYDYLERFNILLIDFRARDDFDRGHIFTRNILCIDPLIMHQGISAAELAEKLILSPEEEVDLFLNRDKFDLVVYYDDHTQSESYMLRPESDAEVKLRFLHEALYEFNQDKPLQRPPILLIGGIDAWVNLMGNQALMTSQTQARIKQGRPLQRRINPRDGAIRVPKRRLREYNPLDPEEEKKWRDRAMSESVPETDAFTRTSEDEQDGVGDDGDAMQKYPDIDDFNARFPEAGSLGQHNLNSMPARAPPERPAKVPEYPSAPSPSVYPPIPIRPAPAAPRMSYTGVSDRVVSHTTPITRSSGSLIPYIPQKYLSTNLRLPRTGLVNFGSTCYMNATLQALSATTPLSILFLDDQFKGHVQKDNWKGSRGLLPDIYANTVRSLWKGDVSSIKPTTLFNFVGRLNSMFRDPGQQQDAQEFFSMIVDVLHEDFNSMWARTPLRPLSEQEEQKRERMPKIYVAKLEWGRYTHRENSFLTSLFYGQQSSRLKCPQCGLTSTQYDAWALLQVEIPDRRETNIQDCFRQHFKDELLDEDNQWTCPNCKAPRRAWKKLTMTRAPPYLVVGFKRFKTNPKTGDQRKIHTAVRFPLVGLDMEEFVLPQPSPQESRDIVRTYGAEALKTDASLTPPYVYDAYAIVRHVGESTRSGHYTAAVRDKVRNCWRYFNDTTATDFDPRTLSSSKALDNDQAYLVFYQRRSLNEATMTNKF